MTEHARSESLRLASVLGLAPFATPEVLEASTSLRVQLHALPADLRRLAALLEAEAHPPYARRYAGRVHLLAFATASGHGGSEWQAVEQADAFALELGRLASSVDTPATFRVWRDLELPAPLADCLERGNPRDLDHLTEWLDVYADGEGSAPTFRFEVRP